jgi:hypothetical protein
MKIPPRANNITRQYSKELKLMFLQFLKTNNALKKYKYNIIEQSIDASKIGDVMNILACKRFIVYNSQHRQGFQYYQYFTQLINYAFCWANTLQGHKYWENLSMEWEKKVKSFVLEKGIKV